MEVLGIAGAVASILGAIWAWRSARAAASAAQLAGAVRGDLESRATLTDLVHVQAAERRALSALAKYGPGAAPEIGSGVDHERDAADVREFFSRLEQNRLEFGHGNANPADRLCRKGYEALDGFRSASTKEGRQEMGREMYLLITGFSHRLKARVDEHRTGRLPAGIRVQG